MYMYLEEGAGNGAIVSTYPIVLNQWDEGTGNGTAGATNWTQATSTTNWVTAGGSFHNGIIGSMETKVAGYNAMPMSVPAWQFAINNPTSDLGMLLINDNPSCLFGRGAQPSRGSRSSSFDSHHHRSR